MVEGRTNIFVGNLDGATTVDDLYDLFGFSNPVLRQSCAIKLVSSENAPESEQHTAEVAIPNSFLSDALNKNGALIRGRPILIAVQPNSDHPSHAKTTDVQPLPPQPELPQHHQPTTTTAHAPPVSGGPADLSREDPVDSVVVTVHSPQAESQLQRPPMNSGPPQGRPFVELDTAAGFDCYNVKSLTSAKVVHTVERYFGEDDTKRLIKPSRRDRTVWVIETEKIHLYQGIDYLKDGDKIISSVVVRRPRVPPAHDHGVRGANRPRGRPPNEGRENEILITLANANTNRLLFVTDDDITREIVDKNFGSIIKKVQPQPAEPRSSVPGKNKFVVLDVSDRSKIPPFFDFLNDATGSIERMYLNYRDKPRWCRLCSETHSSDCPELMKIRQFEKERDEKRSPEGNLPVKIYASSVGRLVNQKVMYADVDAMSGGALGNLINAVGVDEKNKDVKNLIVMGGGNDMNRTMPPNEFVTLLKGTREKIADISPERKVAFVPPPLPQTHFDSMDSAKEELFTEFLEDIGTAENVMVWKNPLDSYEEDFGTHPSADQTRVLVEFLDEMSTLHFGTPLLVPSATEDARCCKQKYGGVNPLYLFGCASCNERTRNKWRNLCDVCTKRANDDVCITEMAEKLISRSTEIFEREHPPMTNLQDGLGDGSSSEDGDLTCPICALKTSNAMEFNQHFKQIHPEEKSRSVRDKARFIQNDGARK